MPHQYRVGLHDCVETHRFHCKEQRAFAVQSLCRIYQLSRRNGENMTVPCQPLVLFDDTLGNVQKADVRFGVGLLSSGDYPQIDVKECLQATG